MSTVTKFSVPSKRNKRNKRNKRKITYDTIRPLKCLDYLLSRRRSGLTRACSGTERHTMLVCQREMPSAEAHAVIRLSLWWGRNQKLVWEFLVAGYDHILGGWW